MALAWSLDKIGPLCRFAEDTAQRLRTRLMHEVARVFERVDAVVCPGKAPWWLTATRFTGHPSLTVRAAMTKRRTPTAVTLYGRLFEEGRLVNLGMALEHRMGVASVRPRL